MTSHHNTLTLGGLGPQQEFGAIHSVYNILKPCTSYIIMHKKRINNISLKESS